MKQFYGKWKYSKKRQALIWKWKKRKLHTPSQLEWLGYEPSTKKNK